MKRKFWLVLLFSAGVLFLCLLGMRAASANSLGLSKGYCLVVDGTYMLVADESPIILSDRSRNGKLLHGLETGDELLVLHDGVQESYPARTGAYAVWKLGSGSIEDISPSVLVTLAELGWQVSVG